MNLHTDDYGYVSLRGKTADGMFYRIEEIPQYFALTIEGHVLVPSPAGAHFFSEPRLISRGFMGLDPEKIVSVELCGYGAPSYRLEDIAPLEVLPLDVYHRGEIADEYIPGSREAFHPETHEWERVPRSLRTSDNPHVQSITINGRRFSRLTLEGLAAAVAADEAAREAEEARLAADRKNRAEAAAQEAAAAALRREIEEREAEERRKRVDTEAFQQWFASLPPHLHPGSMVWDPREYNPRAGEVQYAGVFSNQDGSITRICDVSDLPVKGKLTYGSRPPASNSTTRDVQKYSGEWDELSFGIDAPGYVEDFVPLSDPKVRAGTRIPRPPLPDGVTDEHLPRGKGKVRATLEVIGNEYCYEVDDEFSLELAAQYLMENSGRRSVLRTFSSDNDEEDDNDDDDGSEGRRSTYKQRVDETFEERYPELFEFDYRTQEQVLSRDLDGSWELNRWEGHDRKLLEKENQRRQGENRKWQIRRDMFVRFFSVLGAAICVRPEEECIYGKYGLRVELTLMEDDLDKIAAFLVDASCQRLVHVEVCPEVEFQEAIAPGVLDELLKRFEKSRGKAALFKGLTEDILIVCKTSQFIVSGLVPAGEVGLLVGPAKLGKSSIAVDMCLCVANGIPFCGLETKKGQAVYIFGEDSQLKINERRALAGEIGLTAKDNFLAIHAGGIGNLDEALELIEALPDLAFVVIDTSAVFVPDTNQGGAAREFMNRLSTFASIHGCAVLVVHHTGKDLPAAKARSAKIVFEKAKGSGEFINVARFVLTLFLDSELKDERLALQDGIRHISLHTGNLLSHVPRLLGSLAVRMDKKTGLSHAVAQPVIGNEGLSEIEKKPKQSVTETTVSDEDAHAAVPVLQRLKKLIGKAPTFAGPKSLFKARSKDDLVGWSRARCEKAHRRAVELGLF